MLTGPKPFRYLAAVAVASQLSLSFSETIPSLVCFTCYMDPGCLLSEFERCHPRIGEIGPLFVLESLKVSEQVPPQTLKFKKHQVSKA